MPGELNLLMLLAVLGSLVIIAVFTGEGVRPGVHIAIVVISGIVFLGTLLLIRDLDQPYRGVIAREPTQTLLVRDLLAARGPRSAAV